MPVTPMCSRTPHHHHVECMVAAMLQVHYWHGHPSIVMPLVWAQLRAARPIALRSKYCAACTVACSLSQSGVPHVTPTTAPV
jgi:hypothetical protein